MSSTSVLIGAAICAVGMSTGAAWSQLSSEAVPLKASPFFLSDVRLLDGPFKQAQEMDRKFLLSLEPDRFLHTFRLTAGLPTSTQPYGGWETPTTIFTANASAAINLVAYAWARHELKPRDDGFSLVRAAQGELDEADRQVIRLCRNDDLFAPVASGSCGMAPPSSWGRTLCCVQRLALDQSTSELSA